MRVVGGTDGPSWLLQESESAEPFIRSWALSSEQCYLSQHSFQWNTQSRVRGRNLTDQCSFEHQGNGMEWNGMCHVARYSNGCTSHAQLANVINGAYHHVWAVSISLNVSPWWCCYDEKRRGVGWGVDTVSLTDGTENSHNPTDCLTAWLWNCRVINYFSAQSHLLNTVERGGGGAEEVIDVGWLLLKWCSMRWC